MGRPVEIDISVCIVSYNARDSLETCLASMPLASHSPFFEICVVDNHSSDRSAEMVAHRFPDVMLIRNRNNLGFAKAANQAMRIGRGKYFLLANPDVIVPPGTLETLFRLMEKDRLIALSGCRQITPDGKILGSCGRFPKTSTLLLRSTALDKLLKKSRLLQKKFQLEYFVFPDETGPVDCITGAFILVRRSAIEDVGLLDEQFFLYGEDLDWNMRMRKRGWKVVYTPEASVIHKQGVSASTRPARSLLFFHIAMYKFYRKHQRHRVPPLLRWMVTVGITLKLFLALARHLSGTQGGDKIYRTTRDLTDDP